MFLGPGNSVEGIDGRDHQEENLPLPPPRQNLKSIAQFNPKNRRWTVVGKNPVFEPRTRYSSSKLYPSSVKKGKMADRFCFPNRRYLAQPIRIKTNFIFRGYETQAKNSLGSLALIVLHKYSTFQQFKPTYLLLLILYRLQKC